MKMAIKKIGYSKYLINTLSYGATLAIIQSIAWIVLASIGLYLYYECPNVETIGSNMTLIDFFNVMLRFNYYTDLSGCFNNEVESELLVTPFEFLIWNYVYLIFSIIWLLLSGIAIANVNNWDTIHRNYYYAILWVIFTLAICILDVVLGALLARDIHHRQINQSTISLGDEMTTDYVTFISMMISQVVTGVLMTIVFRGYVVWIINLAFAVYVAYGVIDLIKAINEDQKNHIQHNTMSRGPISAYDNSIEARSARWLSGEGHNMNRPHLTPPKTPSMYGRSDSSYQGEYNQGYVGNLQPNNNYNRTSQPLEAIPNRRTMPWDSNAPSTPKPDYSPQPMRSIRSALKPVPHTKANNYMR